MHVGAQAPAYPGADRPARKHPCTGTPAQMHTCTPAHRHTRVRAHTEVCSAPCPVQGSSLHRCRHQSDFAHPQPACPAARTSLLRDIMLGLVAMATTVMSQSSSVKQERGRAPTTRPESLGDFPWMATSAQAGPAPGRGPGSNHPGSARSLPRRRGAAHPGVPQLPWARREHGVDCKQRDVFRGLELITQTLI